MIADADELLFSLPSLILTFLVALSWSNLKLISNIKENWSFSPIQKGYYNFILKMIIAAYIEYICTEPLCCFFPLDVW